MAMQPDKEIKLYKNTVHIGFWEKQHRYSLKGKDGKWERTWLISPTAAISMIDDGKSRALIEWATRLAKEYLEASIQLIRNAQSDIELKSIFDHACTQHNIKRDEAADKGTKVHNWCEQYIKAKPKERESMVIPDDDENVYNGIIAFLSWVKDNKVKFVEAEKLVYSKKYKYVGLMDAKGYVNGKLACIDFKTSKYMTKDYAYQTAAYMQADMEESGAQYDERWIIKFDKETANFDAYRIDNKWFKEDLEVFLTALKLKQFMKDHAWGKRIFEPEQ